MLPAAGSVTRLISLVLLLAVAVNASEYDHKYETGEPVVLWVNKVGPYDNPQETYNYYSLPFCRPGENPVHKWGGLGEVLGGNELIDSELQIKFKQNVDKATICRLKLDEKMVQQFTDAIDDSYWLEFFLDDLPLRAFVGEVQSDKNDQKKYYLSTHKDILVKYNGDQIIHVNLTNTEPKLLEAGRALEMTYSVKWVETDTPFARRFDIYLDHPFFEHQIHWFSIFNSFMMVIFLTGLVSMILMRTLRKDYAKYAREEDDLEALERDVNEESGWKLVHGDVFRPPQSLALLSALVGTGAQLAMLVLLVILLAIVGTLYVGRGAIVTTFIVCYALTSFISGYVSGGLYSRSGGKNWIRSMILTASLFPFACFGVGFVLNTIAIFYGTLAAIPVGTMAVVLVIWAFISFPLALLGTVVGRNWNGAPNNPCRVKTIPRPIPDKKWYLTPPVISLMAAALWALLRAAKKRLELRQSLSGDGDKALYRFIKVFLALSMAALLIEIVAHWKGWHFQRPRLPLPETEEIKSWMHAAYLSWLSFRADYIASPIQSLSSFCVVLFIIQSLDRTVLCLGCLWIKLKGIKPTIDGDPFKSDDPEFPHHHYPMVLVQIPMCNEREVYEQSISAICQLDWPRDRLLVQVLDDSDDESIMQLIRGEVCKWNQRGVNIVYRHRLVRTGYKAGNLKSAMGCDYVNEYEFVAIFDADFQPNRDFLRQTIPHFQGDPGLGLVQARWSFVNKDENLLTRLQNVNLCFHFEVEQQVNGVFLNFFGFNGTAGVWRRKALEESGGWLERTTVEDMDIAVRAHLCGWKFIFLNDVQVLCELPECYEAYRKQQHRWHSGPMQLFRVCLPAIIKSKVPAWKKANLILLFFLLRKLILPFYSFTLFCVILPLTMFVPEAELPPWVICYIPFFMSLLSVLPAPRSFPFIVPYLLFENTMSVTKFHAMVSGLFQLGSSYEWIVTKKAGRSSEPDLLAAAERESKPLTQQQLHRGASDGELSKLNERRVEAPPVKKKANKIYRKELFLALLLLTAAVRSLLSAQGIHFYFLLFQGISFLLVGLDLVGEQTT